MYHEAEFSGRITESEVLYGCGYSIPDATERWLGRRADRVAEKAESRRKEQVEKRGGMFIEDDEPTTSDEELIDDSEVEEGPENIY